MKNTSLNAHAFPLRAARIFLPTLLLLAITTMTSARSAPVVQQMTAQQLWSEIQPLAAAHDDASIRSLAAREPEAARALYRELLFESATSKLYENPSVAEMEAARPVLAESNAESRALEVKFTAWLKDPKPGVGFQKDGDTLEQMLYLAMVSKLRGEEKDAGKDAPAGTQRELTERALAIAESARNELAVATFAANLSVYALQERRLDDVPPLISRAEEIWLRWHHTVGLYQVPLILGYTNLNAKKWKDAADDFASAARLSKDVPGMRRERASALALAATALRNAGDKAGVLAALNEAVEEQRKVVGEANVSDDHLKQSKTLADLEVQTGGALAALGRHIEASDWYVRAEALKKENYKTESAQLEAQLTTYQTQLHARIESEPKEENKKTLSHILETITDTLLSLIDTSASQAGDTATLVTVAERRLATAREGGNPINIADALEKVGGARLKSRDIEGARAAALEALRLREADPRRTRIFDTLSLLASIAEDSEDWNEAIARNREVIKVTQPGVIPPAFDLQAEPNADIRRVQARMNELDRLSRAKSAIDAKLSISSINTLQGNYSAADELLTEVEQAIPQLFATGAPDEAELLKWIAESKNTNFTSVEVYGHRRDTGFATSKDEEQRLGFAELIARSARGQLLQYRARLYEDQNDLERAAEAYEQANAATANLVGGSFSLSGTYVALARIERARGNYAAAEPPVEAALTDAVRHNSPDTIASLLGFQSALRREEGHADEAYKLASDALQIARKLNARALTASTLRSLGRAEYELGDAHLNDSEQHLRESVTLWREAGLSAGAAYSLDSLGQTLEREGRDDDALGAYIEAVRIIEDMTVALPPGTSAETFNSGRGNRDLYDHLIKLLIRKNRPSEAFQYLERSKSKSLVDALAGANVHSKDPKLDTMLARVRQASDAVRKQERALSDEMSRPTGTRDEAVATRLRANVAAARGEYLASVEEVRRANPAYANLVAVRPTDLDALRLQLPPGTLLISYFPTDTGLYAFLVSRDRPTTVRSVKVSRADLTHMIGEYRTLVLPHEQARGGTDDATFKDDAKQTDAAQQTKPTASETVKASGQAKPDTARTINDKKPQSDDGQLAVRGLNMTQTMPGVGMALTRDMAAVNRITSRLYDALLDPARDEIERADTILIVPSGDLYYLPFHALGRARPDGSIDYLIERKRFAYLASADLLNAVAAHARARGAVRGQRGSMLALGNPDGSLPGASQEVAALSHILGGSQVFTGAQATVARVMNPRRASVPFIHFATHGIINSRDPKESYLLLAGDPGRLSVRDLVEDTYNLSFDGTRLVTLSACNTNIGGLDPGAAYGSLSRAFSKAGAPTVIASLWSVDDNSTRDTMTVFYRELAAGTPKAEALRRAQLSVMHNPRYSHPFFWAPFLMLGDWR